MLHLKSERRVLVDIEIICPPGTNVVQYLDRFANEKEIPLNRKNGDIGAVTHFFL